MLAAVLVLMICQLVGELARDTLGLPIPGPVIGMFVLTALLVVHDRLAKPRFDRLQRALDGTAEALISHMGLLFVPAGVGIIAEADLLRHEWLPILAAVVISTVLSVLVTGLVMHFAARPRRAAPDSSPSLVNCHD